jgi:hypothetical protein
VHHPGRHDSLFCGSTHIATVSHRALLSGTAPIDAALARLHVPYKPELLHLGRVTGTSAPQLGMLVEKVGRTTGHRHGRIEEVRTQLVHIDGERRIFRDLLVIKGTGPRWPFARRGDSGALIVELTNRCAVGLYFAGDRHDSYGLAQPIGRVLESLQATLIV